MSDTTVHFVAKKALFSFLNNTFRLFDQEGNLTYFVRQKAFRLRDEMLVYRDEEQSTVQLRISARNWADARGHFDFIDEATGESLGSAKRNMFKSMLADDWDLMDVNGVIIGKINERITFLSVIRKVLKWIPQTYQLHSEDQVVGTIRQRFNPFQLIYDVEYGPNIDHRVAIATTILMLAVESKYD